MVFDREKAEKYLNVAQDSAEPKNETLTEHRKHCKAKPGNCPFEKELRNKDDADNLAPSNKDGATNLDAVYADAVKRGDKETALRMIREAAAKAMPNRFVKAKDGLPLVLYHGTPSGGFTKFKTPTVYLTANEKYADLYQSPSASSIRFGKEATNPMTIPVMLLTSKLFDTRKAEDRRAFRERYLTGGEEWSPVSGMNTQLSKHGLPDWTEAEQMADFLKATHRRKDAIVVDEGGYFDMNGNLVERGISYVAVNPNSIKSADITYDDEGDLIPLSRRFNQQNDDIRY